MNPTQTSSVAEPKLAEAPGASKPTAGSTSLEQLLQGAAEQERVQRENDRLAAQGRVAPGD